jgi:plasmid stabilization system protein ParE
MPGVALMPFPVSLTDDAVRDLDELYDYIDRHDVPGKADYVLDRIEKAFTSLSEAPGRGAYPKELLSLGIREHRILKIARTIAGLDGSSDIRVDHVSEAIQ